MLTGRNPQNGIPLTDGTVQLGAGLYTHSCERCPSLQNSKVFQPGVHTPSYSGYQIKYQEAVISKDQRPASESPFQWGHDFITH